MRGKKILAALLSVITAGLVLPGNVGNAEETSGSGAEPVLEYEFLVNGEYPSDTGIYFVDEGTNITMSVTNVMIDGTPATDVTYEWYVKTTESDYYGEAIQGADSAEYSFVFNEEVDYMCEISAGGTSAGATASFRKDTLKVSASSVPEGGTDEWGDYQIYDIAQGSEVTLNVTATSELPDAALTYKWTRMTLWSGITPEVEELKDVKGGTCTLTKGVGTEAYTCEVSDGNRTKWVYFVVNPSDTLTTAPAINGIAPEQFERGYMYVAKRGEEVTMRINAASSDNDVTYSWEKRDFSGGQTVVTPMGTSDSLTVTKGEGDQGALEEESYFCYVDDGNERIEVMFVLFELYPYQVTKETETIGTAEVPEVAINNDVEELSNYLLREDLSALNAGSDAEIKLTAEVKTEVDNSEQAQVENLLADNSRVGRYLDLNLYKSIDSNEQQITETGTQISLTIDIPSDMQEEGSDGGREYQVIRIHNGSAEELESVYDESDKTLTFDTDRFSTYAVAYRDTGSTGGKPGETGESGGTNGGTDGKADAEGINAIKPAAKTGITDNAAVWAGIAILSCGMLAGTAAYRRRK